MSRVLAATLREAWRDPALHVPCDLHGVALAECVLCTKLAGECDFGGCTRPATALARHPREGRPVCGGCSPMALDLGYSVEPLAPKR